MVSNTIIGVPLEPQPILKSMVCSEAPEEDPQDVESSLRLFKIRSADSEGQRTLASILINRMYASRGYRTSPLPGRPPPARITLLACEHDSVIGTITVGFDSTAGLHVDDPFGHETRRLREDGRKLCEFTTLAMDSVVRSKRVLASLFHVAYIFAHRMMGFDSLLIEVNPRHVRYYERMLGFRVIGQERLNRRVNAPAVLLCLDFSHAQNQIARVGGCPDLAQHDRSLYPYFFSVEDEAGIVGRLKRAEQEVALPQAA